MVNYPASRGPFDLPRNSGRGIFLSKTSTVETPSHFTDDLIIEYYAHYTPSNVKMLGGGRPGKVGDLKSDQFFCSNAQLQGSRPVSKKVQIPHTRGIIVGQKNSVNDQKSLPRADL